MAKLVEYLSPEKAKLREALQELIEIFQDSTGSSSKNQLEGVYTDFVVLGVFSKIMSLLGSTQMSDDVSLLLLRLISIITQHPKINDTLAELGVSQSILSNSRFKASPSIKGCLLEILFHQAQLELGRSTIQAENGISFLIETLGSASQPEQLRFASLALKHLCVDPQMARAVCENGLPVIIILMLGNIPAVLHTSAEILEILSGVQEQRQMIAESGALSTLFILLQSPAAQQHLNIQRTALSVVAIFSREERDCKAILQVEGSLVYLRDMFSPTTDKASFQTIMEIMNHILQHQSLQRNLAVLKF